MIVVDRFSESQLCTGFVDNSVINLLKSPSNARFNGFFDNSIIYEQKIISSYKSIGYVFH
ncbi:hypothetical protein GCM10022277_26070 [Litoribacillus peritrichatus]|uniref:Thymidylate kinase-like domain-containing protein n=1 Tax=Litoribacillus peritrichatus TaxID=718191 RepID=A0ABP7MRQ9_9GAMM